LFNVRNKAFSTDKSTTVCIKIFTVSLLRYIICQYVFGEIKMAAHTSMLHVRIDDETKAQATQTLAAMGLSVSDAVRLFLHRVVVDQAFPLELKVPNAETRKAMAEADEIISTRHARFSTAAELFDDLEKNTGK
jgi:DNA-damage-inducible protein J